MTKSYPEQLAEWVKRRPSTKRDKNIVAFLAVRDDVKDALENGYPVTTIWAHLYEHKRVTCRYEMFLHYVNRHIRQAGQVRPSSAMAHPPADVTNSRSYPARKKRTPPSKPAYQCEPAGFKFNADPNKEELL